MSEVMAAMHSTMEAVYNITYKPFHVFPNHDSTTNALLFISSVARYKDGILIVSLSCRYRDVLVTVSGRYREVMLMVSGRYRGDILTASGRYGEIMLTVSGRYRDVTLTVSGVCRDVILKCHTGTKML